MSNSGEADVVRNRTITYARDGGLLDTLQPGRKCGACMAQAVRMRPPYQGPPIYSVPFCWQHLLYRLEEAMRGRCSHPPRLDIDLYPGFQVLTYGYTRAVPVDSEIAVQLAPLAGAAAHLDLLVRAFERIHHRTPRWGDFL